MKKLLLLILCLTFTFPIFSQEDNKEIKQKPSVYYFIRHAEKNRDDNTNKNPNLIQKGVFRAAKWSYVLENIKFDAIYSTDYNRTKQTAEPTAEKQDLEITIYDPRNIDIKTFLASTKGQTVLVVGHSNTTPMFVNAILDNEKYPQIEDTNNANLYIVSVTNSGEISDSLLVVD
jgi:broad specificity phosphatase PhoE